MKKRDTAALPYALTFLRETPSTNSYALDHAAELPDFSLVCADKQTAGRGRQGRLWRSPARTNVYATWLLKTWEHPAYQSTWLMGLAVLHALKTCAPELPLGIKWPNDIVLGDKKIAGLLADCRYDKGFPTVALGAGININMRPAALAGLEKEATSLFIEKGRRFDRFAFIETLAFALREVYVQYEHYGIESIFEQWHAQNMLIGRTIRFDDASGRVLSGRVEDVTFDGDLILDGQRVSCGDIHLVSFSAQSTLTNTGD